MSSAAETIKERLGIVEVVSSYTKIDKAGSNYKGRCPFHHEKSPSFFVSPARNSYYCFGCGEKGDIFSFVQEFEKVDFVGALKILAEKAGIELQQFKNENKGENDRLRGVLELSTKFYEQQLQRNAKAISYLKDRGLTDKTIEDWRIGYADNEWRRLHDFLLTKNVGQIDMEKVGLIKRSDKEGARADSVYDRFRARIMFPLFDASARVIGYSGRIFGVPDSDGPKYLNSPDTVLFNKSETLYGYHKAKDGIREWRYTILVEGQMDLLMCHQSGFTNTVATSGTALTNSHLEKLKKLSDNLMLVYDADKAGLKATLRAWTSALALGMDVKVASLPAGEDPASLLLKDKDIFKNGIKHSKHIIDYYIDILVRESLPESQFKKSVEKEVLPYVAVVDSAIERSNFISKVSVKTGIYESDLREEVEKIRSNPDFKDTILSTSQAGISSSSGSIANTSLTQETGAESIYSGNTISYSKSNLANQVNKSKDNRQVNDIVQRRVSALVVWLKNLNTEADSKRVTHILDIVSRTLPEAEYLYFKENAEHSSEELLFEAEALFDGSKRIDHDISELLHELEERTLKEKLSRTMLELGLAEKKHDTVKAEQLLKTCQDISQRLSELNQKREP